MQHKFDKTTRFYTIEAIYSSITSKEQGAFCLSIGSMSHTCAVHFSIKWVDDLQNPGSTQAGFLWIKNYVYLFITSQKPN